MARAKGPEAEQGKLDRDIYRVSELTVILGLNRDTIHRAIRTGDLPAINFGGSSGNRVLHVDVVAWLEKLKGGQLFGDKELARQGTGRRAFMSALKKGGQPSDDKELARQGTGRRAFMSALKN